MKRIIDENCIVDDILLSKLEERTRPIIDKYKVYCMYDCEWIASTLDKMAVAEDYAKQIGGCLDDVYENTIEVDLTDNRRQFMLEDGYVRFTIQEFLDLHIKEDIIIGYKTPNIFLLASSEI